MIPILKFLLGIKEKSRILILIKNVFRKNNYFFHWKGILNLYVVLVVLIVVAVHKGLIVVDKSLFDTH